MSDTNPLVSFCVKSYNQRCYPTQALEGAWSQAYRPLEIVVSVIVPCYHVREYLPALGESLRAQTFASTWEAIFIDDGDPDGNAILDSLDIGRGVKRIIHQQNRGLSAARNAGLGVAKGEIVLFLDPDDTVEPEWIARLASGMDGVDCAWGGFVATCAGKTERHVPSDIGSVYRGTAVKRRIWRAVFGYRLRDVVRYVTPMRLWKGCHREFVGLWSRAYRKSVIGDLRFDESVGLYEDAIFVAEYALRAQSMRVIGETGYRYAIRESGLMLRESRTQGVRHKFELRDARRRIDPTMSHWRGSFLLSTIEVFRSAGLSAACRYLLGLRER